MVALAIYTSVPAGTDQEKDITRQCRLADQSLLLTCIILLVDNNFSVATQHDNIMLQQDRGNEVIILLLQFNIIRWHARGGEWCLSLLVQFGTIG